MEDNIAIIIPAYKAKYFEATLESISKQTAKNYHVYIGDDNSPDNLYDIVSKFVDKVPLTYHRFKKNWGG